MLLREAMVGFWVPSANRRLGYVLALLMLMTRVPLLV